ncbi:hypothetical protein [Leptospira borgpetersenii]|uniref:hypothetical protein n=1 Tax=Leptospira borgpetersenii TaxID=174 RepID=UPI0007743FAA|nr:hypothetical protein [Leptospira borgpetersenii]MBE8364023.1 hypothetical protein [Leptospira borgpetersenii serovar Balcanica]MBE8368981.1 hypothetical protein [Leptospira borgpetersenii serovar Balcanica]MBE8401685.1 hypothetical protein [Leptospira borgpetersenii serovar Tarassovi]MBE8404677.1 hypothetical protein [Leptospira borgpetersenii serovar Tarassovi]MBE8405584.1 hypothetical protein [Leptospira borgpetersenii serovar Tarassovi]
MMKVKISFHSIIVAFLFGIPFGIQAQVLDQSQYQKIKAVVTQTGHIEKETLMREIYAINPNPQEYLVAIAKDPELRVYAISQLNELIADFGGNSARDYLESTISNESTHPSIRNSAVFSYGKTFYFSDRNHAENFLKRFSSHDRIGTFVQNTLKELRMGKISSIRFSEKLKKENMDRIKNGNLRMPDPSIKNP